ncbi:MAG: ABC transporter permease [Actinomycetota bacterium]
MTAVLGALRRGGWWTSSRALAGRSVRGVLRQPQSFVPGLAFPLFFTAVNAAALDRARMLDGFPEVDSYLTFLLPATLMQGIMFSATTAGNDVALDIQNGFFDRLVSSPVPRLSLLLGRLAGIALYGFGLAIVFTALLVVFGATVEAGLLGVVVLAITSSLVAIAIGAFSMAIGFRKGSVEEVQGYFPIFFTLVFLSSAFFPPQLTGGWFETIAGLNPVSWMVNGLRALVITGWEWQGAALALGTAAGLAALLVAVAGLGLRARLRQ